MRRSSASSGRPSLALRVKNVDPNSKQRTRQSSGSLGSGFSSRPSIGGRLSLTGGKKSLSRPSSVGLGGANKRSRLSGALNRYDQIKDPRKVSDKSFKNKNIEELIEFLVENGFPHPISPKILHTPTTKDFIKIYEYLMSFIDIKYKAGTKIDEEVPRMFKVHGYPFTICKSAMYTIGSPHTWPTMLAALSWLRQMIQYAMDINIENMMFIANDEGQDFSSMISLAKLFYDFCEITYDQYMSGQDEFPEREEQFARDIKKYFEGGDLESLLAENKRYRQELDAVSEQTDEVSELKDQGTTVRLDNQKLLQFTREVEGILQQVMNTDKTLENELNVAESEVASLQADNQRKQHIFETQEFSQADVQHINMERQQLLRQISGMEKEVEDVDQSVWNEEMEYGKFQEKVGSKCMEYNRLAQQLQLIPSSAENAHGIDYEIKPSVSGTKTDMYTSVIKPALNRINGQCVEKVVEVNDQQFNEQEILEQIGEMVHDKKEALTHLETQVKQAEETREACKESAGREYQLLKADLDSLQEEVRVLKLQARGSKSDAERMLQQEKARLERAHRERLQEVHHNISFLKKAVTLVVEQKTAIQDHMVEVEKMIIANLEQARKEDN